MAKPRTYTIAELVELAKRPWSRLGKRQQAALRAWRARKAAATRKSKKGRVVRDIERLKKLEQREWSSLGKRQQAELRSWRAEKAGATRRVRKMTDLVNRLNAPETRAAAKRELQEEGTAELARYLDEIGFDDEDIKDVFGFWFYSS